jgi:hypothetical protein
MKSEEIIRRIDQLIRKGETALDHKFLDRLKVEWVPAREYYEFKASSLSFLGIIFGNQSIHYIELHKLDNNLSVHIDVGIGILCAAKDDIIGGWLATTRGLISAEVFSDFLSMADHLLEEGYKDPAAVMAGSVLEEHLRQLCNAHEIEVETDNDGKVSPKKADRLNSELAKANAYNKLDQKQITSWLDLRNKAAHGHYDEYSKEQVALMLQGITDFMTRVRP